MDIFNPNHYIPHIFSLEKPNGAIAINYKNLINSRKKIFKSIKNISLVSYNEEHLNIQKEESGNKKMVIVLSEAKNLTHYVNNGILIIENISIDKSNTFQNFYISGKCEIYVLTHNLVDQLSYITMNIHLDKDCELKVFAINNENMQKSKYNFNYYLGENSNLQANTLSVIEENQYQDDSIQVTHSFKSRSEINYRSLTKGITVSQINSIIPKNVAQSSTAQNIKHTMLIDKAKIFSKPNLEISNSNVSASHGNSIGTIDDEQFFYLQQRGVKEKRAIILLIESEVNNFLFKTSIPDELNAYNKPNNRKII